MKWSLLSLAGLAGLAGLGAAASRASFANLVVFGDSFSDNGRLVYYLTHNGSAPPPGVLPPSTNVTFSGGLSWPQYVQQRLPHVALFDYAIGGASCSNDITDRFTDALGTAFPSVADDQLPSFLADAATHALYANRTAANTLYALWIGTNDLSYTGFLGDQQRPGRVLADVAECTWRVFDGLYAAGARRFVLFNQAPLDEAPAYRPHAHGGAGNSIYWLDKARHNDTAFAEKMRQYTAALNTATAYGVPLLALLHRRWPGALVTLVDVHRLFTDMARNPAAFGAAPANASSFATGFYQRCSIDDFTDCTHAAAPPASFFWFDEVHPSPTVHGVLADVFVQAVAGTSPYGTTYS